jgi:hypothetical protein
MSTSTTSTKQPAVHTETYENNPFFVATNGLDLLFKKAQSMGILIAIFVGVTTLASLPSMFAPAPPITEPPAASEVSTQSQQVFPAIPMEVWVVGGLIVLAILLIVIVISIICKGLLDYTSARLARGETTTINEAFRAVFANFWGYTWVQVIAGVKTFLWTLLFIIPGIIMSVRYSLAGVAYFDKKLRGNESIKHSLVLTKNAWLTTYASQNLLNLLTLGFIQPLLVPGTNAVLYRQLETVKENKPKAHIVSWLTLIIPVILVTLLVIGAFFLGWALINYSQVS